MITMTSEPTKKKPGSATPCGVALLPPSCSDSSSPSGDSLSGDKNDGTVSGETAIIGFRTPRLGTHTPRPRGQRRAGAKVLLHRRGGAASMRDAPCTISRCGVATWPPPPPRRGCHAARAEDTQQDKPRQLPQTPCLHTRPGSAAPHIGAGLRPRAVAATAHP